MSNWLKHAAPWLSLLLLPTLVLIFFHKLAFSNLILARGDVFLYFYPYWEAAADALRNGRIPLWNPHLFMGAPLLANSQLGFFYPLNWPGWLLVDVPSAVKISLLLHLSIAGFGAYVAARRVLAVSRSAGLVAAVAFALGGYLTAQVEHVNQLQGLAWLPWFLVVVASAPANLRVAIRQIMLVGLLFALQLLSGHTQTTFITGVALGTWLLADVVGHRQAAPVAGQIVRRLLPLLLGGGLALALAAIQLLPTLELATRSSRQGGLPVNEVLSFSLHPLLLTRSLLPTYGQSLFSEYVAVLPLSVLALACIGAWQWKRRQAVRPALLWTLGGLLLALGVFTPLYWLLARLPGFDLFRAPARWLVVYALGMAFLAAVGWQTLLDRRWEAAKRPLRFFLLLLALLIAWGFLGRWLTDVIPLGPEAPYAAPGGLTLLGWALELSALLLLLWGWRRGGRLWPWLLALLAVGSLFAATRTHPYNNPTAPGAYSHWRPPPARLQTQTAVPPDRFLSLSNIFFDLGDQAELESVYAGQLTSQAMYAYTIATKQKEIIAPNLPLTFELASVDGFDGGILPLNSYSQLVSLLLPPGEVTTDGRLRENLTVVPQAHWLDLFNARYLITDKVGDAWRAGVFFDRQHPVTLPADATAVVGVLPDFAATEVQLLATAPPGPVSVTTADGQTWRLLPEMLDAGLYRAVYPQPTVATALEVAGCPAGNAPCTIEAVTLVDSRDDTFLALVLGNYRLIHSGDVKIYENLDVLPRAFWVSTWQWQSDADAALAALAAPDFDPHTAAVLLTPAQESDLPSAQQGGNGRVAVEAYAPEHVVLRSQSDAPGMVVLSDALYPGWRAYLDGASVPIYLANGLFRAVWVPAGTHLITFEFAAASFRYGRLITLLTLGSVLLLWLLLYVSRRDSLSEA